MRLEVRSIERKQEDDEQDGGMKMGMDVNWGVCVDTDYTRLANVTVPVSLCRSGVFGKNG